MHYYGDLKVVLRDTLFTHSTKVLLHARHSFHPLHKGVATCTTLFSPTPDGKIIRIVHAKGQTEISKAEHWVRLFTHSYIGTHIYIDDCCNCYFFVTPLTEVLSRS